MTTPSNEQSSEGLVERVRRCRSYSNKLDIEIDIALFKPDSEYVSVRQNAAGTKLVYRLADGSTRTHWAEDHTLNQESVERAIRLLTALKDAS
ncbi:MAG: hypothetical protein RLW68_01650 [Devosia marina]|uniref:hypothetical protein n=1 Tax=Devosia marina TaxID=2683198 RepID=UPI0032EE7BE0